MRPDRRLLTVTLLLSLWIGLGSAHAQGDQPLESLSDYLANASRIIKGIPSQKFNTIQGNYCALLGQGKFNKATRYVRKETGSTVPNMYHEFRCWGDEIWRIIADNPLKYSRVIKKLMQYYAN